MLPEAIGDFQEVAGAYFFKGTGASSIQSINIQFKVNKVKIQFADV